MSKVLDKDKESNANSSNGERSQTEGTEARKDIISVCRASNNRSAGLQGCRSAFDLLSVSSPDFISQSEGKLSIIKNFGFALFRSC